MSKLIFTLIVVLSISGYSEPIKSAVSAYQISHNDIDTESYSAKDYVQDGLVCLWDAIENVEYGLHDSDSTTWANLVDGSKDSILGLSLRDYAWTDTSFIRLTETGGKFISDRTKDLLQQFRECNFTIESVTSKPIDSANWQAQIFNVCQSTTDSYSNGIISRWRRMTDGRCGSLSGATYTSGAGLNVVPYDALITYTCSYSYGNGFFYADGNLVSQSTVSPDYSISGVVVRLGSKYYGFQGHYHCLRIYDRPLTDDEVKHNYEVDKARFNLP